MNCEERRRLQTEARITEEADRLVEKNGISRSAAERMARDKITRAAAAPQCTVSDKP